MTIIIFNCIYPCLTPYHRGFRERPSGHIYVSTNAKNVQIFRVIAVSNELRP